MADTPRLLSAASTTGSAVRVNNGHYNFIAWGTWDGASAQLQFSPNDGTTWIDIDGAVLTANGGWSDIPMGKGHVRVAISGAGGSTSVSATAFETRHRA